MNPRSRIEIRSNVKLQLVDDADVVQDERQDHNVFLDGGRTWLSRLLASYSYPASQAAQTNMTSASDGTYNSAAVVPSGSPHRTYLPRYIGIGTGGVGQTTTPVGTYIEQGSTTRLERQVQVSSGVWLAQLLPQPDLTDPESFPDAFTIRYRAILQKTDVSFSAQPTWGTLVPITETALFTGEPGSAVTPSTNSYAAARTGCIAYHTFAPLWKTPLWRLLLSWDLEF